MRKNLYFIIITLLLFSCTTSEKNEYQLPELNDVVIYQINPRVFAPKNSFQAIIPHLDEIKELGCNIIWLMPIYPIGEIKSKNSPYSVKDYTDVNPEFGTPEDFNSLVQEAHKRQIGMILDWVPNHTAWDNAWIQNKDWYTQDSLGNIIYPEGTDWTDVADLNYDNADMRQAMISAMKHWITNFDIDGFRCDVVDFVPYDFLKECIDTLRSIPGKKILMLGEGTRKDHFDAGFDLNYAWDFAEQMRKVYIHNESAATLFETNTKEYENIPEGKLKMRFTTNHDEAAKHSPIVEWINEGGSMSAFAVIAFMPGCPMIYGSQETGYPEPINFFQYTPIDWNANPELRGKYQKILSIHDTYPGLRCGKLKAYPDENILLFERYTENETYFIAINTRNSEQKVTLPEEMVNRQFENLCTDKNISLGEILTLQPFEYLILGPISSFRTQ